MALLDILLELMPWCGLIKNDIVSAESNFEHDASDGLFSSAMPDIFLNLGLTHISCCTLQACVSLPNSVSLIQPLRSGFVLYHMQRGRSFQNHGSDIVLPFGSMLVYVPVCFLALCYWIRRGFL